MKPKPLRQKEGKTFTFQPFSERITNLNIDIFHRVGHKNEEIDNERETFLYQAIVKWNGLNSSESYNELCKELTHHVKILPQVIAQKEKLVNTLMKYVEMKNEFSLEPTLEFIVALAKDLTHQEFYEYFPRIFPLIINLLYCKDYEQIEWAFQCLAYLFKIQWKQLVQDIDNVLTLLLPLLNDTQPLYIINFSAQSFAFVARKIKNRKQFIHLILKALKKHPEGEDGCGTLLFETIKGVSGKLHSVTQSFLTDVVNCLGEQSWDTECLTRVLSSCFNLLLSELEPGQCSIVWTILNKKLFDFLTEWTADRSPAAEQCITHVLTLMKIMALYKRGVTVTEPRPVVELVVRMVQDESLSGAVLSDVVHLAAALQRSPGVKISQEYACQLAYNVLRIPHRALYLEFIELVFSCAGFNTLVLPSLLNLCETGPPACDMLQTLTKLILHKVPSIALGSHFDEWRRIGLDFTNKKQNNLLKHMVSLLDSTESSLDDVICIFIIAPHVTAPSTFLTKFHEALKRRLQSHEGHEGWSSESSLYVYTLLVETMLRIDPAEVKMKDVLDVLGSRLNQLCALRTVDLCLSVLEVDVTTLDKALTSKLKTLCVDNLCSPYSQIRSLSSHMLTRLSPLHSEVEVIVFELIHQAETTDTTLQSYRDKLSLIHKLETYPSCPAGLRYMFGMLYVNFSLLWKPVCANIVSLGETMEVRMFWSEYSRMLAEVKSHTLAPSDPATIHTDLSFIEEHYTQLTTLRDKADHGNVRVLLWETLAQMKKLISQKNRDVAVLFLDFVNDEFRTSDAEIARVWNIRRHEGEEESEEETSEEEDEEEEEEESPKPKGGKKRKLESKQDKQGGNNRKKRKSSVSNAEASENEDKDDGEVKNTSRASLNTSRASLNTSRASLNASRASLNTSTSGKTKRSRESFNRNTMRLFLAHFNVMSSMSNPKSVHREPEIRKIYEEFLCHRNSQIQKVCLDCLLNYKSKECEPYRDSLYALVDDKTFRNHLIMFAISDEEQEPSSKESATASNGRLKAEHRPVVMRLVLRIVYGKMLGGAGPKSGSKSSGAVRRAMILRFLAGCKPEEFDIFLDMAFKVILSYVSVASPLDMIAQVRDSVDLEQVIPPKRLLSLMNLAFIVLSHCGSLAMEKLLKVILSIGSYVGAILVQRSEVHSGYLNILGKVRTNAVLTLNEFFERYSEFQYTLDYVDAIFDTFVWAGLEKLNSEGVYSPTALTKMLIVWSKEPKYFPLLAKYQSEEEQCALGCLVQLLLNNRAHISVKTVILDVIENLVTLEDEEGSEALCVRNTVVKKPGEYKSLNYGSFLLKPYVLSILKHYQTKLKRSKKQDALQPRDLTIVSRITELVSDEKTSHTLANVLVPLILSKVRAGEAVISPLLTTLLHLMRNVTSSQANQFLRSLGVLYLTLVDTGARTQLLDLTAVLAGKIQDETINMGLLRDLHAMNRKFVEQPDFDRRLDAFNRIQKMVTEEQPLSPIQGVLLVYTAMHYLQYEKDISMRTSSSYCLQKLCPHLCRLYQNDVKNRDYIVHNTILSLIRNNLQCKKTDFKEESIMLLGYMVRESPPSLHPVLSDLQPFSCKADLETDLFETILHVQLHRRSRAMLKFIEQSKTLSKPMYARTITQYLVPVFSQFLLCEKYLDKNTIVDAAIQALSTCARLLGWREYEALLSTYLGKLKSCGIVYQKQLIKIVSALLEAFHFDLSKAYDKGKEEEILPVEIPEVEEIPETEDKEEEEKDASDNDNDDEEEDGDDDDDEDTVNNNLVAPGPLKMTMLSKAKAARVIFTIHRDILPGLYKILVMRPQSDSVHKVNRKSLGPDRDEEDLMKIPVALTIVQLLQKLPTNLLERNLPSLFTKLCTFCRSKLESVRKLTRETLQKIMGTLGARYLGALTKEMKTLLSRGFQAHVLAFTLHAVLVALRESFTRGDLDHCTLELVEVFSEDLFGEIAEEKDVAKIQSKVAEARSQKSYDAFCIMAQYISEKYLLNLVMPAKDILSTSLSHKLVFKASECLRHIALGLADNKFVTATSQLTFAYGVVSQSISALAPPSREEKKSKLLIPERPDCYIIPKEPRKRLSSDKKTAAITNANIIVEFGLRLYQVLLKRERLRREGEETRPHLDAVVPIMAKCLSSEHVKLNSLSLQCLTWLIKMDLPSIKEHITPVTSSVFALLHKYAAQGMGKGDNYELVLAAFKYVGVLLRDVKDYALLPEQLATLLLYVEQDLHDHSRQASAFLVLKAILHRKLQCGQLEGVMEGVASLAITSYHINVRVQARQAYITYLYEYPLDKKVLESHLSFILSQLDYEILEGRDCALDMIASILTTFPKKFVADTCDLVFVSLAARLINEPTPELRKKLASLLRQVITGVDVNHGEKLLDICLTWLRDEKVAHRRLGAQLCGIFLEASDLALVDRHLSDIMAALRCQFVELTVKAPAVEEGEGDDHHVYQALVTILKLLARYPQVLTEEEYQTFVENIGEHCQRLLSHAHVWIRLASCQILFKLLSSIPPNTLAARANADQSHDSSSPTDSASEESDQSEDEYEPASHQSKAKARSHASRVENQSEQSTGFLSVSTRSKLRSLILDHVDQLGSDQIEDLMSQVMKNLVYLAQVLKDLELREDKMSLRWIVKILRRKCHEEIVRAPLSFTVRKMCFNWLAALAVKLSREELGDIALSALAPLVREMGTTEDKYTEIRQAATEAAAYYKKRLGSEVYLRTLATLQQRQDVRKAARKTHRAQELIKNPQTAAKRKITKQLKRKEQKKKKMEIIKKKYKHK